MSLESLKATLLQDPVVRTYYEAMKPEFDEAKERIHFSKLGNREKFEQIAREVNRAIRIEHYPLLIDSLLWIKYNCTVIYPEDDG